jgi:hypothetical protein
MELSTTRETTSYSIVSQHFMKPEGSIPNSQELSTCSYPSQTNPVYITPSHLSRSLGRLSKESVQVRGSLEVFVTGLFLRLRVVSPTHNPQAGGPPLVFCPWLLFQYIRSTLHSWRPFLYPQPEDAPCCGDRDPT